jgi:antitoxin MazE
MPTLVKIGNSQGIRIPKAIIDQADLNNKELVFKIVDNGLLITPVSKPRDGWKVKFNQAVQSKNQDTIDQEWLDARPLTDEDWEW